MEIRLKRTRKGNKLGDNIYSLESKSLKHLNLRPEKLSSGLETVQSDNNAIEKESWLIIPVEGPKNEPKLKALEN